MIREWKRAVIAWYRAAFMIALIVPEYKGIHWCKDENEVYDWMNQYPNGTEFIWN